MQIPNCPHCACDCARCEHCLLAAGACLISAFELLNKKKARKKEKACYSVHDLATASTAANAPLFLLGVIFAALCVVPAERLLWASVACKCNCRGTNHIGSLLILDGLLTQTAAMNITDTYIQRYESF